MENYDIVTETLPFVIVCPMDFLLIPSSSLIISNKIPFNLDPFLDI